MASSVDSYLEARPPAQYQLLVAARRVLLSLDERIREDLKWGVPFYSYDGPWAYLTVVPRASFIHVGLIDGVRLADPAARLVGHELKNVRHLRLATLADVHDTETLALLHQALLLRIERGPKRERRWVAPS
jgi:hypothetical protein